MKQENDQRGIAHVATLVMLVVIVGVIGFVGWKVWDKTHTVKSNNNKETNVAEDKINLRDISNDWQTVVSTNKVISLKIPDGWKLTVDEINDTLASSTDPNDITYKKGVKAEILSGMTGGTDAPLRIFMFSYDDPSSNGYPLDGEKNDFTTYQGIKGMRYTKTYGPRDPYDIGPGPVEGEIVYTYIFSKNEKYVSLSYSILPGDPNNLQYVEEALRTLVL